MDGEDCFQGNKHQGKGEDLALVTDYSEQFTPNKEFSTREELVAWVQEIGRRNGLVIIIRNSDVGGNGRRARVNFVCERYGHRRSTTKQSSPLKKKQKRSQTSTKKCGCPFFLNGKNPSDGVWTLKVACGTHNHSAAKHLEGHAYAGRLKNDEIDVVIQMSKSNVRPKEILMTLKERNVDNYSTLKTIYNARQKHRLSKYRDRSHMQQLLHKLDVEGYVEWHRCEKGTNNMQDLFWAHPVSVDLLRCFPLVLLMDSTYKINKYKYPLLKIVGVTSTEMTFSIALMYMAAKTKDDYTWALQKLRDLMEGYSLPKIIVTNKENDLMNAISEVFPEAVNLLCTRHICEDVFINSKAIFAKNADSEGFMMRWNDLIFSNTIEKYNHQKNALFDDYQEYKGLLEYINATWLIPYKERFVKAWTNKCMHLGSTTTTRVESEHVRLEKILGSSQGNFETFWIAISTLLSLQYIEIKSSFENSSNIIQHYFQDSTFTYLRGFISRAALEKICLELARVDGVGLDISKCGCVLRRTHGLPCAHELALYKQSDMPIPLSDVDNIWKKLDLIPQKAAENDFDFEFKAALTLLEKKFNSSDASKKVAIVQKIREIVA